MISRNYPYLSIAKNHGVEYEKVLKCAHILTHGSAREADNLLHRDSSSADLPVLSDVCYAVGYFRNAQNDASVFGTT